jgi:hypothetical protein
MSADLVDFLAHFRPDGHTTFVGIVPDGSIIADTFNGADPGRAAGWIEAQNRARGVYFTVNPTPADLRKKPTKADINAIAGLWSDIDPQDNNHGEWLAERKRLIVLADELAALSPPPTFIVDSGSGLQPVWLLTDPIEVTTEYREAAETLCARLEAVLGASGTHNVDRLLRVPGTINFPNQKKRDLGRDKTQALLLHATWQRYTWRDLEALVIELEASPPRHARPLKRHSKPRANGAANGKADTLPPYPDKATIEALLQDLIVGAYWQQSFTVTPGDDRSASGWDLARLPATWHAPGVVASRLPRSCAPIALTTRPPRASRIGPTTSSRPPIRRSEMLRPRTRTRTTRPSIRSTVPLNQATARLGAQLNRRLAVATVSWKSMRCFGGGLVMNTTSTP